MTITEEEKEMVKESKEFAESIMRGEGDGGYDGADGAREVIKLCKLIEKLTKE